jgi:uncharacterized coiled-coil protein SlyX
VSMTLLERLDALANRLDAEGAYTDANIADLASEEIRRLYGQEGQDWRDAVAVLEADNAKLRASVEELSDLSAKRWGVLAALRARVEELTELLERFDQFASEHSYSPDNIIVPEDEFDVEGLIFAGNEEVKLWRDVRAALARAKGGE